MKKIMPVLIVFLLITITGCAAAHERENPYFHASVIEVNEKYVLVQPFEGEEELKSADQIQVSTEVVSTHDIPAMEEGTQIRIVYNGDIAESYPAQINTVFAIYLIDENGEMIESDY